MFIFHWLFNFLVLIYEQINKLRNHLRHLDYDPINLKHPITILIEYGGVAVILKLTNQKLKSLHSGLANMNTQLISDNIDMFPLQFDYNLIVSDSLSLNINY